MLPENRGYYRIQRSSAINFYMYSVEALASPFTGQTGGKFVNPETGPQALRFFVLDLSTKAFIHFTTDRRQTLHIDW